MTAELDGLAAHLQAMPDEALADLLVARPGVLRRPPTNVADLASQLSQQQSVVEGLQQVDRGAVQVAALVALRGGRALVPDLAADLSRTEPVDAMHVTAALDRLAAVGLAWPGADCAWRVPKALRQSAPSLLVHGPPARAVLGTSPLYELRSVLSAHGLGGVRSIAEAVNLLAGVFENEALLRALLAEAPPQVGALLERLLADGTPEDTPAELWASERLLVVEDAWGGLAPVAEVSRLLLGERYVVRVHREPECPGPVPSGQADRAVGLVEKVRALLGLVEAAGVAPLKSGGVGVTEQRRLGKRLGLEQREVAWLLDLAGEAGLLGTGQSAGRLTSAVAAWLALDEAAAYVALASTALDGRAGPRLLLDPEQVQVDVPPPLAGWRGRHHELVGLRAVAEGGLRCGDPDGLVAWLDWRHHRPLPRRLRLLLLQERVLQLELLALCGSAWVAPLLASDSAAAAAVLRAQLPPEQEQAVWQADATAFVAGRPSGGLRALLGAVAGRESERTWRVSADAVRDALDGGASLDGLLAELRERSRHVLPTTVEQAVIDVGRRHGLITVVPSQTLLRVADAALVQQLLRDRQLVPLSLTEVVPGVLASTKKPAEVLLALRRVGHAPTGPPVAKPKRAPATRTQSFTDDPRHQAAELVRRLRR